MQDYTKGLLITIVGVLVITPDTLLIRLIDAGEWPQLFWRGGLSAATILLCYGVMTRRNFPRHMMAIGRPGLIIGLVFALGTVCFMYSATHTLIANTLFITATAPVFAAVLSWLTLGERVSLRTALTIVATLFGIAIIAAGSFGSSGSDQASFAGDLAALGAALSMAVTFTLARARKSESMVPAMGLAGLITAGIAYVVSPTSVVIAADDVLWIAVMGVLVVPLGFALMATGPRFLPAADVSLLLLLESVLGPLLVWAVMGEFPGAYTLVGGSVVLAALFISNLSRRLAKG